MAFYFGGKITLQLQADGWIYSYLNQTWSREWDGEIQYGEIRDGQFVRLYPNRLQPAQKPDEPIDHERESKLQWSEDPKFTVPVEFRKEGEPVVLADLRDQFAMHAMQGILAKNSAWDAPNLALKAYEFADAMMIAREMKHVS